MKIRLWAYGSNARYAGADPGGGAIAPPKTHKSQK